MNADIANEFYKTSNAIFEKLHCSELTESNKEMYMTFLAERLVDKDPISLIHAEREIVEHVTFSDDNKTVTFAIKVEVTTYFDTIDEDDPDMYIGGAYTYKLKMDADYYKQYWNSESSLYEDFSKNRVAHLSDKLLDTCRLLRIFEENTSLSKYYYYLNLNKRLSIKFNGSIYLYDTTK